MSSVGEMLRILGYFNVLAMLLFTHFRVTFYSGVLESWNPVEATVGAERSSGGSRGISYSELELVLHNGSRKKVTIKPVPNYIWTINDKTPKEEVVYVDPDNPNRVVIRPKRYMDEYVADRTLLIVSFGVIVLWSLYARWRKAHPREVGPTRERDLPPVNW